MASLPGQVVDLPRSNKSARQSSPSPAGTQKITDANEAREMIANNPRMFISGLLGHDYEDFHRKWFEFQCFNKYTLILAPRDHGKTKICTMDYVLFRACRNPNLRMLILSATDEKATGFMREIRHHLEYNDRLRAVFGDILPSPDECTQQEIWFKRTTISQMATIAACGIGSSYCVGKHFDIVILDDIHDDKNTATQEQIRKVKDFMNLAVFPTLEPEGQMHAVGTRWHFADYYSHLLKIWPFIVDRADPEKPLWLRRWPKERLLERREQVGPEAFAMQYLNDPSNEEIADLKRSWLKYYKRTDAKPWGIPGPMRISIVLDPGRTTNRQSACTAFAVGASTANNDLYLIEVVRKRFNPAEVIEKTFELVAKYNPLRFGVERDGFHEMYEAWMKEEMRRRATFFSITELSHGNENKDDRIIKGAGARAKAGALFIPEGAEDFVDFIYDWGTFPRCEFKDGLDAVAHLHRMVKAAPKDKEEQPAQLVVCPGTGY